jgi:OmcA/MtrC family decaheme c-type cytochrome
MLSTSLVLILLAAAGGIPVNHGQQAIAPLVTDGPAVPSHSYAKGDVEYYMTDEQKEYIRPGLTTEIVSVEIPADRKPVVELTFTDDMGLPLDRAGALTPGPISASFVFAWWDNDLRHYTAYTTRPQTSPITGVTEIQASADRNGSWEDLEIGRARYTFGTVLPDGFDGSKTHTMYVYTRRNTIEMVGKEYFSDPTLDFRPDGGEVTETWGSLQTETCNTCHDPLALHGGPRRAVKGCVLCHQPQSIDPDTGNTVDMKVMIHKIHMGADLPSVQAGTPYVIIGNQQSVHDFSDVRLPQDVRNCTSCHPAEAAHGDVWYSEPGRAACGACHDDIDWVTGANHAGGPQADDSYCSVCHQPQGDREFDASVIGAHTIPTKSAQLAGLSMEILEVTGAEPGGFPTVTFRVANGDGSLVQPSELARLRFVVGGPTTDYTVDFREDAADGTTVSGDTLIHTFVEPIPEDATGTWAIAGEASREVTIDNGTADGLVVSEPAFNPIVYVAVTDQEPIERREVVTTDNCNRCHDVLAFHGGRRLNVQECLICHNPTLTDEGEREPGDPAESGHMKWMIHRIHSGAELVNGYEFNGTDFSDVGYPGDRRNCEGCHAAGTYNVPLPEGTLETPTARDWYTPMQPAAAACLSCHSSVDAAAHAYVNTAPFGEACAACHGADREFSVDKVHAR